MTEFNALGRTIYYDERSTVFSLFKPTSEELESFVLLPPMDKIIKTIQPTAYTFCIDVSDVCNLCCDYCFNKNKSGRTIDSKTAISYLEKMFDKYPNGEKYFVDMSGKGEPLLALKTILEIAAWCKKKQDEIKAEVLPQFVCNGTLLTPSIAKLLQDNGILFGVSLDGNEDVHDRHRKDAFGEPTFDKILNNIKGIEHREYIGCAATITKDVFPLVETIDSLLPYFKTLSFRPARGDYGLDLESEKAWEKEYDLLGARLLEDIKANDKTLFMALMNGEDYLGRYLVRTIGSKRTFTRCDATTSRFALDIDGQIYPCPACAEIGTPTLNTDLFSMVSQAKRCLDCPFKYFCGGECPLVLSTNQYSSDANCAFRKKLIVISMVLAETMRIYNPHLFRVLNDFCAEKVRRLKKEPELYHYMEANPNLTFTEAKTAFDKIKRRY